MRRRRSGLTAGWLARRGVALTVAVTAAILLSSGGIAIAQTSWNAPAGDWSDANRWTAGIPISDANAIISNGGTATISQPGETCKYLYLGTQSSQSGSVNQTSGTLMSSQTEYVGYSGTGVFTQSGGNNTASGALCVGYMSGSTGRYRLNGTGTLTVNPGGSLRVGAGSGVGRFEWFGGALMSPDLSVGSNGTLAIGFNFDAGLLANGSLFDGAAPDLSSATLEITNGATVTEGNSTSLSVGALQVGSLSGVGRFEWFGGTLTSPVLTVGSNGTLAIGFNFDAGSLANGSLSHGSAPKLSSGTLETTSGATATLGSATSLTLSGLQVGGRNGPGIFTQTDGNSTISGTLYLGYNNISTGTYQLSGNGNLTAGSEIVGYTTADLFAQCGGRNTVTTLYLGYYSAVTSGTYQLGGTGILVAGTEYVGFNGIGLLAHSEGNNTVTNNLYVGYHPGTAGTYQLSGNGCLSVSGKVFLAWNPNSSGTFQLSGNGVLKAGSEYVGYSGAGVFTQTGGQNTVSEVLSICGSSVMHGPGTYRLNGTGSLTLLSGGTIQVGGGSGPGRLEWFGGTLTTPALSIGRSGTLAMGFDFDVGSLVSGSMFRGSAPGLSSGVLEITNGATATLRNETKLTLGALHVGSSSGYGIFIQTDESTVAGPLYLGCDSNSTGAYNLCGNGYLKAGPVERIGYYGTGVFTQSGGNNTVSFLYLAYKSGSSGTYQLDGNGILTAIYEIVGSSGKGIFTQSGGDNTVTSSLMLGLGTSSSGTYHLTGTGFLTMNPGGSLQVGTNPGVGRFEWFGGTLTTPVLTIGSNGTLAMGFDFDVGSLANGSLFHGSAPNLSSATLEITNGTTATLRDGTALAVSALLVGSSSGDGGFVQNGGMHTISGQLYVGTSDGNGTYVLSGGQLVVPQVTVGPKGTMILAGGSMAVSEIDVDLGGGSFAITDPTANITVSSLFRTGGQGAFSAVSGSVIHMTGTAFVNNSTDPNFLAGLNNLRMIFAGADFKVIDPFEVGGRDYGATTDGQTLNFAMDVLELGGADGNGQVFLVNRFDNQPRWDGNEVLYVKQLIVHPGSTLYLNGIGLYANGVAVSAGDGELFGGGEISPLPEPMSAILLAGGAAFLIARRRRGLHRG